MTRTTTRREALAWFIASAMFLAAAISVNAGTAEGSYGDDGQVPNPSATAEEAMPVPEAPPAGTPRTVYIATGLNFPDALGAAAAGGVAMGPVLLVQTNSIPAETLAELNRLAPNKIVIVGGTAVVSDTVKAALEGLAFGPNVTRLAGTNRYDTAAKLSADVFWTRGFHPRVTWQQIGNSSDVQGDDSASQIVATTTHTPVLPGIYAISAGADVYGGPDNSVTCAIYVDGVRIVESARQLELNGTDNSEEDCATQAVFIATAVQPYTIDLVFSGANDTVFIDERSVIATWEAYYPGS